MKDVRYSDQTRQPGEVSALLDQTISRLEEILGPSAATTEAEWDRTADANGKPVFTLRISDWTGEATASFTPPELAEPNHVRVRLLHLWGELLQERNHRQLRKILALGNAEG